jgi:hypothetical protein
LRKGPEGARLWPEHIAAIDRTVRRVPEVMVKVLPRGGGSPGAVAAHFDYVGRHGELDFETDDGRHVKGKDVGAQLIEDWDLDLDKDPARIGTRLCLGSIPQTRSQTGAVDASRNTCQGGDGGGARLGSVTATRSLCTRMSRIPTFTSSSKPSASKAFV